MAKQERERKVYESYEDEYPKELINAEFIISMQINDCRRLLNSAKYEAEIMQTQEAVDTFESLLIDLRDDTYKNKVKALDTELAKVMEKLTPLEIELRKNGILKEYARKKFELLISLSIRKGKFSMKTDSVKL